MGSLRVPCGLFEGSWIGSKRVFVFLKALLRLQCIHEPHNEGGSFSCSTCQGLIRKLVWAGTVKGAGPDRAAARS